MKIIAIDSGVEKTGWAVFKNKKYLQSGLILTDKKLSLPVRLKNLYRDLKKIIKIYQPKKLILEQLFFFKNKKTIISVGQAQGIILFLAAEFNLEVEYLTPLQIKQSLTGYGLADKKSIKKMLELEYKLKIKDDNQADAVACGFAYFLNQSL